MRFCPKEMPKKINTGKPCRIIKSGGFIIRIAKRGGCTAKARNAIIRCGGMVFPEGCFAFIPYGQMEIIQTGNGRREWRFTMTRQIGSITLIYHEMGSLIRHEKDVA